MSEVIEITKRRFVGTRETLVYGIANSGQVMTASLITGYLTYFYVNIFNIDPVIVASMLLFEGIWDAFNDPLMGSLVDKTRTRWGKFRPYLLGIPAPMALVSVVLLAGPLLINDPNPRSAVKIVFMFVTYTLWELLFTISDVPFWGMSAAISPSPEDRTRAIASASFLSRNLGGIPTTIMPIMMDLTKNGIVKTDLKQTFFITGSACAIIGMGLFFLAGIFTKERVAQSMEEPRLIDCFKSITKNGPLKLLIWHNLLGALGNIGGIFGQYYFIDVLGNASASLFVWMLGSVVTPVSYAFIGKVKERFNNKQIVIISKLFNDFIGILMFFLSIKRYADIRFMLPMMSIRNALSAIFHGVGSVVPKEMIIDTVDYMEWKTGQRSEGMSFAVLTLVGKLNGALSRALGSLLISVIGYKTSHTSAIVPQTEAVKFRIFAMNSIVPTLLGLFAIIPILFYDLVGEKHERILRELTERRESLAKEATVVNGDAVTNNI